MKFLLLGNREFTNIPRIRAVIKILPKDSVLVTNATVNRGTSVWVAEAAKEFGLTVEEHKCEESLFASTGDQREAMRTLNEKLRAECDAVIVFWAGRDWILAHLFEKESEGIWEVRDDQQLKELLETFEREFAKVAK